MEAREARGALIRGVAGRAMVRFVLTFSFCDLLLGEKVLFVGCFTEPVRYNHQRAINLNFLIVCKNCSIFNLIDRPLWIHIFALMYALTNYEVDVPFP